MANCVYFGLVFAEKFKNIVVTIGWFGWELFFNEKR